MIVFPYPGGEVCEVVSGSSASSLCGAFPTVALLAVAGWHTDAASGGGLDSGSFHNRRVLDTGLSSGSCPWRSRGPGGAIAVASVVLIVI